MSPDVQCPSWIFFGLVSFDVFVVESDGELVAYSVYGLQEIKVILSWVRVVRLSDCSTGGDIVACKCEGS